MPSYQFEALDAEGAAREGVVEADSARAVRGMLRAQALAPISVNVLSAPGGLGDGAQGLGWRMVLWRGRSLDAQALATWTRQLAGLVSAGLPLERALTLMADEADDERQRHLVSALRAEVNAGSTFGKALGQFPAEFSDVYRAVVAAGESSGSLGMVLDRLADDLEERQALRAKLLGAALYPAIVTLVAMLVVGFLATYVLPQVAGVFAGSKRALPPLTVAMLAASAFLRLYGWWLLGGLALLVLAAARLHNIRSWRLRIDAAWLRLPLVGRLARAYNTARFAATLALLAQAGVPILKALQAALETLNNRALRTDAQDALALVREGAPLASALAQKERFPPSLCMFARLGEQTGQLPATLERAATQLGADVQRRALALATILEPLLILAMGVVVMLIVLAVLLPIIQLNQLVK